MAKLWGFFIQELGSGFVNQYGGVGESSYQYWARQLAPYSQEQVRVACQKWKDKGDTFISIAKLRSILDECMAGASQREALALCLEKRWSELPPVFQHVVGARMFDLRKADEVAAKRMFADLYAECMTRIRAGEVFEPVKQVTHNPSGVVHSRMSSEQGRASLRDIIQSMKGA